MIFFTDGQVFENRIPKASYIAVITEQHEFDCIRQDEKLISFIHIGYKLGNDTEGLAILHALKYIAKHKLIFSTIYTDSLSWVSLINGHGKMQGKNSKRIKVLYSRQIYKDILVLKNTYNVKIFWKSRKYNKAGHFLAHIWNKKQEIRNNLKMEETNWADVFVDIGIRST